MKSLNRSVARIRQMERSGRYRDALSATDNLLQRWPENSRILLLRARLIQLQESDKSPRLEEAKACLLSAVNVDGESPEALLELAHFMLAVEDQGKAALRYFDRAITLCKHLLKDALLGRAEALAELERNREALASLAEAYSLLSRNGKAANSEDSKEVLDRLESLGRAS